MGNTGADYYSIHLHFAISTRNDIYVPPNITSIEPDITIKPGPYDEDSLTYNGLTYYNPESVFSKGLSVIK